MSLSLHADRSAPIDVPNFEALLDPFPHYAELAAIAPVVRARTHLGVEIYFVTQWDAAHSLLRDDRLSKTGPSMREGLKKSNLTGPRAGFPIAGIDVRNLLNTDPPDHTRLRNLVNLVFSPRRIEVLRLRVEALVDVLLQRLEGRREADMVSEFAYPIGITMICELLGVPDDGRGRFREWATHTMSPAHPEQNRSREQLLQYLQSLIDAKRKLIGDDADPDAQPDVLAGMIAARVSSDALTEDELVGMAFLLLIAGHETTVGLISNTLRLLAHHPEQREILAHAPELTRQAVEEVLRFDGPVHRTTMRCSKADIEVGDLTIPRASFVQVLIAGCNRDPIRFPDPNRFDITRKTSKTLAFGYGEHFCIGQHLAKLEAQTALARGLKALPGLALACSPEEIHWAGTVVRCPTQLPMRWGFGG